MKKRRYTPIDIRNMLLDMAHKAGGVVALAEENGVSYSNLYRTIRGEGIGDVVLNLVGKKRVLDDKAKEPRYEDI